MYGLLLKAWRDLMRRPTRTALTMLGVAIGVAGLVAIVSTARNLERAQRAIYASTSQADLTYWVWNAPASLATLLRSDPRVTAAELRATTVTRWRGDGLWRDIELVGIPDLAQVTINQFEIERGHAPTTGEILLDVSAAQSADVDVGSEIVYRDPYGRQRVLVVSGISRSPSYLSSNITNVDVGYVPAGFVQRLLDTPGYNQLLVKISSPDEAQRVVERIGRLLRRQRIQFGAPEIRQPDQYVGKRELDALIMIMLLFACLGLVLSSFLIINTLSATVAEQIEEIGLLKTIGAERSHILALYLLDGLTYGLGGTAVGLGLGALLGWRMLLWIGTLGNASAHFSLAPEGVLLGIAVGLGVSSLAGLIPARQGARISVREAISSYGIRSDYGAHRLDRVLQRIRGLPPLGAMAVRNLGRRPARSLLTLGVIALATASFIGALTTRRSVNGAIRDIYATYNTDAWVSLGESVDVTLERQYLTVEGVRAAEGWGIANGHVGLTEARLWGLPPETQLYRYVLRQGRWFGPDESDAVVLSSELADDRGLRVGDAVEIQVRGQSRTMTVVGIAIDNTIFLGGTLAGKAFMPRTTLSRLLGNQNRVSLFALGLSRRSPVEVEQILRQVEFRFQAWRPTAQPVYVEIAAAQRASQWLSLALVAMLVIVALVGALGILNTLTLNVLERRREIAVLRAIGGTNQALAFSFLSEAVVLAVFGWMLGILLGYPAGFLFTRQLSSVLFTLDYVVTAGIWSASLAFTLCLALAASLGPALASARISAGVNLRYE
jgi:putative ABC transport system permease protein